MSVAVTLTAPVSDNGIPKSTTPVPVTQSQSLNTEGLPGGFRLLYDEEAGFEFKSTSKTNRK